MHVDHRQPYPGDRGIQFEPKDASAETQRLLAKVHVRKGRVPAGPNALDDRVSRIVKLLPFTDPAQQSRFTRCVQVANEFDQLPDWCQAAILGAEARQSEMGSNGYSREEIALKRVYVFVQGPTDATFLRRVLPHEVLKDAELVDAGGYSGIPSLARSVLVARHRPVAVVMNSGSVYPEVIEERQQSTEELIQSAAAAIPVKVVSAVPETEAWFFAAPEAIERVLGQKVPAEWVSLGRRDPQWVLDQLTAKSGRKWDTNQAISSLDAQDIERIRALPEVVELTRFLQDVQRDGRAA
jgi:hypothetical protein